LLAGPGWRTIGAGVPTVPVWLPNAISALRIALVPAWAACAELANRAAEAGGDPGGWRGLTLAVLATIGVSDVVDGWLARRFRLQSATGAMLDAVADKLAQVVAFTYLALRPGPAFVPVPAWFLVLLIARDALLLVGWLLVRRRAGAVDAEHRFHGKVASLLLFLLLFVLGTGLPGSATAALLVGVATLVVISTALYARDGWRQWTAARG
jgi:phosphatidylglycerophosphate synthase